MLSFGLVNIPVELLASTRPAGAALRFLDADGTPLQRKYFCPEHDEEVPQENLVHGYELDDGQVVVLTDEELEAVDPKKSREIDLQLFVDRNDLDPLYFEHGYFLVPREEYEKAYRLLASVMEKTGRAGIARFVMRDKEYLVAILADHGLLRAETLRFRDEVRSSADVGLPKPKKAEKASGKNRPASVFGRLIDSLEMNRLPTAELADDHAEAIRDLARKKLRKGEAVQHAEPAEERREGGADVVNLMAALKRSLGETQRAKQTTKRAPRTSHKGQHPKRRAAR